MLTLASDPALAGPALAAIADQPAFELGERVDDRIAAVLETSDEDHNRDVWRWLNDLAGVHHVDVVFVSLETPPGESASTCGAATHAGDADAIDHASASTTTPAATPASAATATATTATATATANGTVPCP
ncbi:MAG: hypothetical protein AB8G96_04345 [Phycisphaerales bacterium]